jgi:GT2 family glycosyltransferase
MNRPLISYLVCTYNQEAYIRQAVESAFAQTYSPLEIVLSDDCSRDATAEIIQKMAEAYRGPHRVRVNRNPTNLGIGKHVSRAAEFCQGELIVLAAGDDISVPERTETVVRAWEDSGRRALSISSRFSVIDQDGQAVPERNGTSGKTEELRFRHEAGSVEGFLRRRRPHVAGCANAISPRLFSQFGAFPERVTYEDTALCFRTVLAGGMFTFINAPLVRYRRHGENVTFGLHQVRPRSPAALAEVRKKQICELERFEAIYDCFALDATRALEQGLLPPQAHSEVMRTLRREAGRIHLRRRLLQTGWSHRVIIFCRLYCSTIRPREMLSQLPHLLPRAVFEAGLLGLNRIRA